MTCRDCDRPVNRQGRSRCRKCERARMGGESNRPGVCSTCQGPTSSKQATNCHACASEIDRPVTPFTPDEESKFAALDRRLTANGRCQKCFLLNPCGGHVTAEFFAHLRNEVADV